MPDQFRKILSQLSRKCRGIVSLSLSVSASLILFLWLSLFSTTVSFVYLFLLSLFSLTLTLETFWHDRGLDDCSTTLLTLPSIEPYLFLCLVSVGPAWWLLSCGYYILSPFLFTGVCFLCSVCIAFFFSPVELWTLSVPCLCYVSAEVGLCSNSFFW